MLKHLFSLEICAVDSRDSASMPNGLLFHYMRMLIVGLLAALVSFTVSAVVSGKTTHELGVSLSWHHAGIFEHCRFLIVSYGHKVD